MCDLDGNISEGASSNFFIVRDGRIFTPPLSLGILAGVTRATVFALAAEMGAKVEESVFQKREVLAANEAFLTSSIRGLMPVTRLDGEIILVGPKLPALPEDKSAESTAAWIQAVLRGEIPVPDSIAQQVAHCKEVARSLAAGTALL